MQGHARISLVALCLGLAGCCGSRHGYRDAAHSARAPLAEQALAPAEPGDFSFDVGQVRDLATLDSRWPPLSAADIRYRAVTAEQCCVLAAQHSTVGNLLSAEAAAVRSAASTRQRRLSRSDSLHVQVLKQSALEARNRTAGTALELYYRLVEAEANARILDDALRLLDEAAAELARAREADLPTGPDPGQFARERLQLQGQRVELERSIGELNTRLKQLIGLSGTSHHLRLWPQYEYAVQVTVYDPEREVARGLASRPELAGLRTLQNDLDAETVDVAKRLLAGVNGLLGGSGGGAAGILGIATALRRSRADAAEVAARRAQVEQYTRDREQEIATDIRQAVDNIAARLREVALAEETRQAWERRVEDLRQRREVGRATYADVVTAQLALLRAQSAEVSGIVAWQIAEVKLREAQGLLVEGLARH